MRKRHQYRILQAAFVFALIGLAFFGSYAGMRASEQPHPTTSQQRATHTEPKPNAAEPPEHFILFWKWLTHDATGVFTIVLCLVTGALAIVTYLLYRATVGLAEDAAGTAKSEFLATHRPRLRARYFKVMSGPSAEVLCVRFGVVNIGDTVATAVSCVGRAEYFDTKTPLPPFMSLGMKTLNAPSQLRRGELAEVDILAPNDVDLMARMITSGWALHAFGLVSYSSEDGASHWRTAFCRQEEPISMRMSPVNDPDYEYED